MLSSRGAKPLVSIFLSLLLVLAFVLPFFQYNFLAGPLTPFDKVQAGAIRFGIIMALALIWLGVQLFWKAPSEATKLGMAASATIIWLALVFFFNFEVEGFGGAMAFFVLMGGLAVTLMWTRFLADEINF
ncbi:MAG TPA: hypothetical protein VH591_17185 [Ktedonobacterales bacterium]|jgi:hypothetical protein